MLYYLHCTEKELPLTRGNTEGFYDNRETIHKFGLSDQYRN